MSLFGLGGPEESAALIEGCYTLQEIPGKRIIKSLGLIEYTKKGIAGDAPKISNEIFHSLFLTAKEKGANAVVNVRLVSGSYHAQGSQWEVTYVVAYGDAVIAE
ncbi:heavy metal-binding domain-containing protein [Aeromonas hydrophila]